MAFSFIHCADLHLDTPFSCRKSDEKIYSMFYGSTFKALSKVVDLAIQNSVNFVLFAGDIYDVADKSLHAQIIFRNELERLAERDIRAFICHGNHDHLQGTRVSITYPDTAYFFGGDEVETIPVTLKGRDIACIYGISHAEPEMERNLAIKFKRRGKDPFSIGLLHANVEGMSGHGPYAGCRLEELVESGMDYWALGHIHKAEKLREYAPFVLYPGNTQGRNVKESGPKGCYLVNVSDSGKVNEKFLPTAEVIWVQKEISIEGMASIQEFEERIREETKNISREINSEYIAIRLHATGQGPLHKELKSDENREDLRISLNMENEGVWIESLEAPTALKADRRLLIRGDDLIASFLQEARRMLEDCGAQNQMKEQLQQLFNRKAVKDLLGMEDVEISQYIEPAVNYGIDLLYREDE